MAQQLGVGGDRTLAAAAHGVQKSAFRRHALKSVVVIQVRANGEDAHVVFASFDANGALADTGQHRLGFQVHCQQAICGCLRHRGGGRRSLVA